MRCKAKYYVISDRAPSSDVECGLSLAVARGSLGTGEERVRHRLHLRRSEGPQPHQHSPPGQLGRPVEMRTERAQHGAFALGEKLESTWVSFNFKFKFFFLTKELGILQETSIPVQLNDIGYTEENIL